MKILQIAHVNVPINAKEGGCGGLEEVIATLDKKFSELGHESFVVASSDSVMNGILLPTIPSLYGPGRGHLKANQEHIAKGFTKHAKKTLDYINKIKPDIIHDHTGYHKDRSFTERIFNPHWNLRSQEEINSNNIPPILNTIHGYVTKENTEMYKKFVELFKNKNISFNAVSQFQRAIFRGLLDVDYVVHNAIDVDSYTYGPKGQGYLFNMSSIYPGKGTHIAIDTALRAGKKLIFGGPYYHHKEYFEELIRPKIDRIELDVSAEKLPNLINSFLNSNDKVLYLGEIGSKQKRIIYTGADAFLFPVTIDETFGLVSAEANASGVPVITYLSGGIPEVVNDGVSGYTVKRGNSEQLYQALLKSSTLSRKECRNWANKNFRVERQANDYLKVYNDMILKSN